MNTQKGNILIILSLVAVLAIGAVFYLKAKPPIPPTTSYTKPPTNQPISTKSAEQTKTFKSSSVMKFSIELPAKYQVEEKFTRVTIMTPNGTIYISRSGTNFDNLDGYLKDLQEKNRFTLSESKKITKGSLTITSGFKAKEKEYFIFADGWVYLISTTSESLFNDLDKIAQSFRYTP